MIKSTDHLSRGFLGSPDSPGFPFDHLLKDFRFHREASSGTRLSLPFVVLEGTSFLRYGLHSDQCRSERTHFRM